MEAQDRLVIQQRALEALQESTKTLEIAEQLLKVGNIREAERLRDEAREQRNVSVWLMSQAGEGRADTRPQNSMRGQERFSRIREH